MRATLEQKGSYLLNRYKIVTLMGEKWDFYVYTFLMSSLHDRMTKARCLCALGFLTLYYNTTP